MADHAALVDTLRRIVAHRAGATAGDERIVAEVARDGIAERFRRVHR